MGGRSSQRVGRHNGAAAWPCTVDIHQASVSYNTNADRLLLRVRTRDDQLFQAWLTRRLMLRLWQPLGGIVTKLHLATATPHATVVPEAQAMVAQVARTQSRCRARISRHPSWPQCANNRWAKNPCWWPRCN